MTFDDFQAASRRTSAVPWDERPGERLLVQTLGLCGEAGELADMVKKSAWHGQPLLRERVADEIGDILWYLSDLATACGLTLDQCAAGNIAKLNRRYPEGFVTGGGMR